MRKSSFVCLVLLAAIPALCRAQVPATRRLAIDDVYRMRQVGNPQLSPEGHWVAYTVSEVDRGADKRSTALWMANWEGSQNIRLTFGKESAGSPLWSPDGRYLSYLASDGDGKKSQI